jgi:porin
MSRSVTSCLVVLVACLVSPLVAPASAEEVETTESRGFIDWLADRGVAVELVYAGEVFANLRGGITTRKANEYRGNFDLTFDLDLEAMGLWSGGSAFVYVQSGHGRGITKEYVGDAQALSNLDAHEFTQISGLWIEQEVLPEQLRVRLGKQDCNADFCALDSAGLFFGSSFGVIPTVPLPTFPDPALSVALLADPVDWLSVGGGIYDGAPEGGSSGFDTTFDGDDGLFSLVEIAFHVTLGVDRPGHLRFGAWHHSGEFDRLDVDRTSDGSRGLYFAGEQTLVLGDGLETTVFVQAGWAPEDRSEIDRYLGGGATVTGLLPGRDDDVLGLGVEIARFSSELDLPHDETAVELTYAIQILGSVVLQPDFQFISHPSGNGKTAWVAGIRIEITF